MAEDHGTKSTSDDAASMPPADMNRYAGTSHTSSRAQRPRSSSGPPAHTTQSATSIRSQPQWNANYIPPPNSASRGRRPSSPTEVAKGAQTQEELLRRLSLTTENTVDEEFQAIDPRKVFPELQLSGNVISATVSVPYKIRYGSDGTWELNPRPGTSALFDSFSYLASSDSPWKHTLVGWTGEIERLPKIGDPDCLPNGTIAPPPLSKASAPIPLGKNAKPFQPGELVELRIPRDHRVTLETMLERDHGGCVEPVWLPDRTDEDDTMVLRDQKQWRRYGEHELFTLFHYKQNEPTDGRAMKKSWERFVAMNHIFADVIMAKYRPGDIVLIHDYQLLLLPEILHKRIQTMYIGFFLHVPFPSSEYYRCLTKREEILKGILGANIVGFQSYSYSRHFSSCCQRLLDMEASPAGVDWNGLHTAVDVFPIGINATTTLQSASSPLIDEMMVRLRRQHSGKKIIVGRDRLDSVRGVVQKLQAYEIFLEKYPEWHDKVVLIQVTSPTSIEDRDDKNDKTEAKISELVARINGHFGTLTFTPVLHYATYLRKEEYFALLRIADLGLITSVRDGMNTTALEYILCQRDHHSPLIISEFSGTAGSLSDAIHINPWDLREVADAIDEALQMSEEDKRETHGRLFRYVKDHTIQHWTNKFLRRLLTNLVAFDRNKTTPLLDSETLLRQYRKSSRRLFMFDYDGTLTPIVNTPEAAIPSDKVIRTLKSLASDPRNAVWIISGRDQEFLNEWMGHIPALGLSAEHGCFMRMPNCQTWENLTETFDMSWQDKVFAIFQQYTDRTMGSFIERKKIALTWHYRKADPQLGPFQAQKCHEELEKSVTGKWEVEVMKGKANLEVRPKFVNKGEIARRLVEEYGQVEDVQPDFVLCAGDDTTDEDMFRSLRAAKLNEDHVFAVTIGPANKQTLARWHLQQPEEVITAISLLIRPPSADDIDDSDGSNTAFDRH